MAVPVTGVAILRVLLQIQTVINQCQRDMRNNASTWKAVAQAQTTPVLTLAANMNSAAVTYQTNLGWISTMQGDPSWPRISAMYIALGGSGQEFADVMTPLQAVANQLRPAAKGTYAQIIGACDQILAAINAPLTLWPE